MNPKLLQLVSPALPVGAYSYSQGLEAAIEAGAVHDAASAARWIGDVAGLSVASLEAPIVLRLARAWKAADGPAVARWNGEFIASREAAELRAEALQMGYSLRRLLRELDVAGAAALDGYEELSYPAAFAFAAAAWNIDEREALGAYLFAWMENQVLAAVKTVPLGQTDGQRILAGLGERIAGLVDLASTLGDEELASFAPGYAIACARHETQYSRLYRS